MEKQIELAVRTARSGFVDYFEAALWLANYPVHRHDGPVATLRGVSMMSRELDRRHGKAAEGQSRSDNADYRRVGASRWEISVSLVRAAAYASENEPLVTLIDAAEAMRREGLKKHPPGVMTRAAMIETHEREWSTIRRDLQDASENGLTAAARVDGGWYEPAALEWARSKWKWRGAAAGDPSSGAILMADILGRRYPMGD